MPTITIRDVPAELLERIKQRAKQDRRSVTQQTIHLLERALQDELLSPAAQAERWLQMSRWRSRRPASEEITDIYKARTKGR
ncbi:MAG: FitA-like ribbon-helix-helix domain-containing protein [Planctomycetota bacterium]|jgi:plasmid stability protein